MLVISINFKLHFSPATQPLSNTFVLREVEARPRDELSWTHSIPQKGCELVRIRDRGTCVFLNSHLLSELEMVCDRVAILVQGEVAAQGTIEELTSESRRYEIEIDGPPPAWADSAGQARVNL